MSEKLDLIDYTVTATVQAMSAAYAEKLEDLTTTTTQLASSNRSLKDEVGQLRNKLADTKAITTKPVQTKSSFKPSNELQTALLKAKALQSSLDHAFAEEEATWTQQQLTSITARTKQLLEENAYQNALKSDFATAQAAINRKKQEVNQHGVPGYVGISGEYVKGIFDKEDQTFTTFEQLFASSVEINGYEYHVVKADLSNIGAGHVYHLQLSRGDR